MDDEQFRQILDYFGLTWKGYRRVRNGVKKRLVRYMQDSEYRGVEFFLAALNEDQMRQAEVGRLLTVSISRFFRDWNLWKAIAEFVLPEIISKSAGATRVWSAGCARGEEAYSFVILWENWSRGKDRVPRLKLWATDMNPEYLIRAQKGVYSSTSLREIPEEWRPEYFHAVGGNREEISESIKGKILWEVHDLIADPPPAGGFHIIFLRNSLLTYYSEALQRPVLAKVIESLSPGGFLIVGSHEKLRGGFSGVEPVPYHRNIYYYREKKNRSSGLLPGGSKKPGKTTPFPK
jgi:chemotaxis protein methyltransferase CheR